MDSGLLEGVRDASRRRRPHPAVKGAFRVASEHGADRGQQEQEPRRVGDQAGDHQQQPAQHQEAVALARCRGLCRVGRSSGLSRHPLEGLGEVAEGPPARSLDHRGAEHGAGDQDQQHGEAVRRTGHHGQQPDLQHQPGGDAQRQEGTGA
ncbi:hypothetical protein ADK82_07095 [Streptomyces sp. NRRL S-4]|nr:hypothetical protein ADK82_07095 [Streptomyces sp. NRRL S-4]